MVKDLFYILLETERIWTDTQHEHVPLYMRLVENQLDQSIKALKTDRGCEYLSEQFKELYDEKGIERQLTMPHTPQQNSVAEKRNRTLLEMVRSMMAQANLPIL